MEVVERLVDLLVILVAARIGAEAMKRANQAPVIGELVAGLVVGVGVLGWVVPTEGDAVSIIAEVGVILLLFEVGLETDVRDFVRLGKTAASVAVVGVVTPFVLGYLGVRLLSIGGGSNEVALFMGAAMTATSVGLTARIFADLKKIHTDEARTIVGAAVIDDLIGLIVLAVVVGVLGNDGSFSLGSVVVITGKALAFLGVTLALGVPFTRFYFGALERAQLEGSFIVGAVIWALAVAVAADLIAGLDPIVGAFAAGLVIGQSGAQETTFRQLKPLIFLFVPVFFVAVGASVDVSVLADGRILGAGAVISVLAVAGKLAAGLGVWERGVDRRVIGVGMVPRGEVGLIFAAVGTGQLRGVIPREAAAIVVLMVIVTTLLAPIVLTRLLNHQGERPEPEGGVAHPGR